MSWMAVAGAVVSVASGVLGSKSKKKAAKKAAQERLKMIDANYQNDLKAMQLNAGLEDYYNQLEKSNTYQGRLNYGAYNNVSEYLPDYTPTSTGIDVPTKPSA